MVMITAGGRVSGLSAWHVTIEERIGFRAGQLPPHSVVSATAMPGEPSKRSNIIDV